MFSLLAQNRNGAALFTMTPEEEIQALMREFDALGIPKPKGNFRNPEGLRAKLEEARAAVAGEGAPVPVEAPDPYPVIPEATPEPPAAVANTIVEEAPVPSPEPLPEVTSETESAPVPKKTPADPLKESLLAIERLRLFSSNKQVDVWLTAIEKTIIKDFGL